MARFFLAFIAALTFALGPSAVSATDAGCARAMAGGMVQSQSHSSMAGFDKSLANPPCCDHAAKGCAKACAMTCVAATVAPSPYEPATSIPTLTTSEAPVSSPVSPTRAPNGADPPPR